MDPSDYRAVVIGGSAGSSSALGSILDSAEGGIRLPIIIVIHRHPTSESLLTTGLFAPANARIGEADEKERIEPGRLYVAPANYHLLVERNETFSLCVDEKVNWARPSIDVLFESAARVWRERVVGVLLSGANADGAAGLRAIKDAGGMAVVQDPDTAQSPVMPQSAIKMFKVDQVLSPEAIGTFLSGL